MTLQLVNTTSGVWYQAVPPAPIGPQSLSPGNANGNMLVAFVGWENTTTVIPATEFLPASAVCDSQGNWWRLAGDTGNSGATPVRTAIWVCASARAIPSTGWWSASIAGYVGALAVVLSEFSGLPTGYEPVIDFSTQYSSASTSDINLTAVAVQADYCFAAGLCLLSGESPPSGEWAVAGASGLMTAAYATFAAGEYVDGSFTLPGANAAAGVMVGISQTSYPPANGNSAFPVIRLEAAFGATTGDPTQSILDTAWTDISQRAMSSEGVTGIAVSRGRQYELATPESGEITALLNNIDGAFDPVWPGSPYYSNALNVNMSFQSGITPWQPYQSDGASSAVIAWSSEYGYASGTGAVSAYCMEVTATGLVDVAGAVSELVVININNVYSASAWFLCPAGWTAGCQVGINWYDASLMYINNSPGDFVPVTASTVTWAQATVTGAYPPSNAVFAQVAAGLGSTLDASVTYYMAEAAITTGSQPVQSGLVRLETPVRVSGWWHGRRYPIGFGYVERWPQSWPEMPQWGFSPMIATDIIGAVNSVNLPSAVQGEILADQPYVCLPFNESYQTTSNTINGTVADAENANGLIAVNTSRVNQRTANYISGDQAVETGQTLNFQGDSGTGMGVSSYDSIVSTGLRGSGAVYGPDAGLPVIGEDAGCTFDFWVTVPSVSNGTAAAVPLLQLFGQPYIASITPGNRVPGWVATVGVIMPVSGTASTGTASLYLTSSTDTSVLQTISPFPLDALNYVALTVLADNDAHTQMCLNGSTFTTVSPVSLLAGPLTAVSFGQASYSYGNTNARWNYALAYGSIYPYALVNSRYALHYASGTTGMSGDNIMQRAGRYAAWAQLNTSMAGPGDITDAFELSAAYSTDGSSLATALNGDAQSAGATWYGNASGNLVILPRPQLYRQPVTFTLGDNAIAILNYNPDFAFGAAGWSAALGGILEVTAELPAGAPYPSAALVAVSGGETSANIILDNAGGSILDNASSAIYDDGEGSSASGGVYEVLAPTSVTGNGEYVSSAWVWTTQSEMITGIYWNDVSGDEISSSTAAVAVQPVTWTYISTVVTAPSNAASAYVFTGIAGSGTSFYATHITLTSASAEIPYLPDVSLDYDNTYVQNVTQASLVQGPNTLIAPIEKNLPSISTYLTRGPQGISVNGASAQDAYDVAYWYLNKYAQPQLRVAQVTVNAASNPLFFEMVLQTDISAVGVFNRRPVGAPLYSLPVVCERVSHAIGPGIYSVQYQLSPYVQEGDVLVTDVTGENTLGSTTLAW
jgi:hypothetical protein